MPNSVTEQQLILHDNEHVESKTITRGLSRFIHNTSHRRAVNFVCKDPLRDCQKVVIQTTFGPCRPWSIIRRKLRPENGGESSFIVEFHCNQLT